MSGKNIIKKAFLMPYTVFIIDEDLVESFIGIIRASRTSFAPTFHEIRNNQELIDVIFTTKKNRDSVKYIKIDYEHSSFNILALQTFIAMAEFNRITIFLEKIPQGLEIKGPFYKVSNEMFENSFILEDTGFFVKSFN
jgi:hypothetical protein